MSEKSALVTGGSNGLGKEICHLLAKDGWSVVSVDLQNGANDDLVKTIVCDLSSKADVARLLNQLSNHTPFDLVILNAGQSATGKFETIPFKVHEKLMRLNAEMPMVIASYLAANKLLASNSSLVFIASLSHFTGYPGAASYAAIKDALSAYANSIRKPFFKLGIRVACAFPGPIRTEHAARHSPTNASADKRQSPQSVAKTILSGVAKGQQNIYPSASVRMFALAGRLLPRQTSWIMRKIIYEKLDQDVY